MLSREIKNAGYGRQVEVVAYDISIIPFFSDKMDTAP